MIRAAEKKNADQELMGRLQGFFFQACHREMKVCCQIELLEIDVFGIKAGIIQSVILIQIQIQIYYSQSIGIVIQRFYTQKNGSEFSVLKLQKTKICNICNFFSRFCFFLMDILLSINKEKAKMFRTGAMLKYQRSSLHPPPPSPLSSFLLLFVLPQ